MVNYILPVPDNPFVVEGRMMCPKWLPVLRMVSGLGVETYVLGVETYVLVVATSVGMFQSVALLEPVPEVGLSVDLLHWLVLLLVEALVLEARLQFP